MEWYTLNFPATLNDSEEFVLSGVVLERNKDGRLVVVAVDRQLQEHEHALQDVLLGMEILKVNNVEAPFVTLVPNDHPLTTTCTRLTGLPVPSTKLLTLVVRPPTASTNGLFTQAIYKPTASTKVGIAFWQSDPEVDTGYVLVDRMVASPAKSVAVPLLKLGHRVLSINNQLCYNCKETANQVRNAQGLLTLLVQIPQETRPLYDPVVATFPLFLFETFKTNPCKDLGLTLDVVDGKIVIAELSKVFSSIKNDLRVGMELLSINNVRVETPDMAHALLTGAVACALKGDADEIKQHNVVTLLAQHYMEPPPGTLVTVSVYKNTENTKLGLIQGMQMPQALDRLPKDYQKNGHVVIRRITETGLIAKTQSNQSGFHLEPGMILHQVTIQGKTTRLKGLHNKQVSQLLRTAGRGCTVTFLAEVPTTTAAPSGTLYPITSLPPHIFDKLDTVALIKKIPHQSLGMTLTKVDGSPTILVQQVETGGLAAASGVRVGMQILQVNNTTVQTVLELSNLIQTTEPGTPVSLLVLHDAASFIPPVVTGSVHKETKGSKVGIKLRKYKGGSAIVSIKEDSISSNTDLLGGLLIQSINNVEGDKVSDTEQAANMLIDGQGDITILAVTPEMGLVDSTPFVTATLLLTKESSLQEEVFTYQEGKVWISEAGMKGLFTGSALRVGMEVVALNNIDCSLLAKPEGIMSMLEPKSDGRSVVTVLAKKAALPPPKTLVTATVYKETCESKIGLTYVVDNTKKKTIITRIDDGSLAAATKVLPGMEILTINNSPVQGLDREGVAKLFAEASGVVNYVGVPHEAKWAKDDRMLIVANLDKKDQAGSVGIKVLRDHYNRIVVCEIEEGSLAASSDLIPGLVLVSVNNIQLMGKTAVDVMGLLQASKGMVTILAEASPFGKLVTGTMVKESPETKLGVTMVQRNGRVLIKRFVSPESLTAQSDLEIGMWLKSINNKDVSQASVMYAAKLLGRENPVVTVLAETTTETFEEEEEAKEDENEEGKEEEGKEEDAKDEGETKEREEDKEATEKKKEQEEAGGDKEEAAASEEAIDESNHED